MLKEIVLEMVWSQWCENANHQNKEEWAKKQNSYYQASEEWLRKNSRQIVQWIKGYPLGISAN